jgi:hypothetical protein
VRFSNLLSAWVCTKVMCTFVILLTAHAGLEDLTEEEIASIKSKVLTHSDLSPWPNKAVSDVYIYAWSVFFLTTQQSFLLDILDNLPHIWLSSSQLKLILWLLKELGVQDVPSYDRFQTMQTEV